MKGELEYLRQVKRDYAELIKRIKKYSVSYTVSAHDYLCDNTKDTNLREADLSRRADDSLKRKIVDDIIDKHVKIKKKEGLTGRTYTLDFSLILDEERI